MKDFNDLFGGTFQPLNDGRAIVAKLPCGVLAIQNDDDPSQPPRVDGKLGGWYEPHGGDPVNFGNKLADAVLAIIRENSVMEYRGGNLTVYAVWELAADGTRAAIHGRYKTMAAANAKRAALRKAGVKSDVDEFNMAAADIPAGFWEADYDKE